MTCELSVDDGFRVGSLTRRKSQLDVEAGKISLSFIKQRESIPSSSSTDSFVKVLHALVFCIGSLRGGTIELNTVLGLQQEPTFERF